VAPEATKLFFCVYARALRALEQPCRRRRSSFGVPHDLAVPSALLSEPLAVGGGPARATRRDADLYVYSLYEGGARRGASMIVARALASPSI